jgi:hypothetical protein
VGEQHCTPSSPTGPRSAPDFNCLGAWRKQLRPEGQHHYIMAAFDFRFLHRRPSHIGLLHTDAVAEPSPQPLLTAGLITYVKPWNRRLDTDTVRFSSTTLRAHPPPTTARQDSSICPPRRLRLGSIATTTAAIHIHTPALSGTPMPC